jgi:hypothetical protein
MKELLKKLDDNLKGPSSKYFFNDPAGDPHIRQLEENFGIVLPESFKQFLKTCDGGFISLFDASREMDLDTLAWNSNYILSLEEIGEAIDRISYKTENLDLVFIPFLHTTAGEYLGFMNPLRDNESKIYDLWHEASAWEWKGQVVYECFADLLEEYINNIGVIETIG